jgi:MFS transporter, DHA2 family, multidrug resistance protein
MALSGIHAEYEEYAGATRWLILIAVMLGTLLQVIDSSIVNVAIPQMMGNLGVTLDQISWVSTSYIIACVIVLPLTGWLSSTFGRKRYLAVSIVIFTAASFFCGTSRSLGMLVFFRIIQGAGGAALLSTAQATMMEIFPPAQLGMVQAIYGVGVMVGPTVGPTLGGWITDNYSWPWTFFINLPVGIIATIMVTLFLHDSKHKRVAAGVDFIGIGLLAMGLGAMQIVLEKGNHEGWFESPMIIWLSLASVIALIVFVIWELRNPHPAVNLHVLKNRSFAAGTVFATVLGFGLYGGTFVLPIFLQDMRLYTAEQSGFIMLPGAIASAVAMMIVGRSVSRFSARNLVAIGAVGFAVSMLMLSTITMDTGPEHLFLPLILRGAAMGFLFVPLTLATLMGLRGKHMADATGLYNLSRQIGGSFGIACLSTFLSHRTAIHRAFMVERINIYSSAALQRINEFQAYFQSKGASLSVARHQALSIVDQTVQGQAALLGFEDVFRMAAVVMVAALPLLMLFKKGRSIPGHKTNSR